MHVPKDPSAILALVDSLREHDHAAEIARVEESGVVVPCRECGHTLSAAEIVFYRERCEQCEGEWMDDITAWMQGGAVSPERASEFELMYGAGPIVMH